MFSLKSTINKNFLLNGLKNSVTNLNLINGKKITGYFYHFNTKNVSTASAAASTNNSEVEKPKLKIVNPTLNNSSVEQCYYPVGDIPFFTIKKSSFKKRPKRTVPTIKTAELDYSAFKLNDACKLIRGKYLRNAIEILEAENTKGAKIIREELQSYLERVDRRREKKETKLAMSHSRRAAQESEENEIKLENGEEPKPVNENSELNSEKSQIENPVNLSQEKEFVTYNDYKIVEAYVGKKNGHGVPSPRAKGKMDMITRNISRLFIYIERVKSHQFFEEVALGKADVTFAYNIRQKLFMSGAPLSVLKNYSFITTAKGRYYRRQQFQRLVTFLRNKYYKEKGIKLNTEVVTSKLKSRLGIELAKLNPTRFGTHIPSTLKKEDFSNNVYNKLGFNKIKSGLSKETPKIKDTSLKARERHFNKNFNKIE